jgi:MoaA/NifB/PqqE/SkfB family radical SAM enzyme
MIAYRDIRHIHLELSTFCNARCPLCSRNYHGYPYNDGYPEVNMTLDQAKEIFSTTFLKQLNTIILSGNLGDALMNPQTVDILDYFRNSNSNLEITLETNGSGRNKKFWQDLAELDIVVRFALEGLADTHHLYRQDTDFNKILSNARAFIDAGGIAIWKMVPFNHNQHQIEDCEKLAYELGFKKFIVWDENRNSGPVYDKQGELVHVLGEYDGIIEFKHNFKSKQNDMVLIEDIIENRIPKKQISCQAKRDRAIYVAANGEISPCCWLGFYPKTFGRGGYHQAVNSQISKLAQKNNALEHPLEECLQWFTSVEQSWKIPTYETGRLVSCDDYCGSN